jgi:hypothetical protein
VKNKKQAIQTYSIPFFIKSYSNFTDKEQSEEKSLIEKLNDFFDDNDHSDFYDDGDE